MEQTQWVKPAIEHGVPTKWNWVVLYPGGLGLGDNTDIGAFTLIQAQGGVIIGDDAKIGAGCSIYSKSTIDGKEGVVKIGRGANIGAHSTVMPGVTVGDGATVGAHSFVNKHIPEGETWIGNPVKRMSEKVEEEQEVTKSYKGVRTITGCNTDDITMLYRTTYGPLGSDVTDEELLHNEFVIMKNGSASGMGRYNADSQRIELVNETVCSGIMPRNVEQKLAMNLLDDNKLPLVSLTGMAGTGKTLLAVAAAIENRRKYRRILISRPTVPLSNKDSGFLPGDLNAKLDPFMRPLYDNIGIVKEANKMFSNGKYIDDMMETQKIVVEPLSYIRGRSLDRCFFIIDEAQNLTPHEIKTIITRAGDRTKIVLTGDTHQIDQPGLNKKNNGLAYLIERMKGQKIFGHVALKKGERSELATVAAKLL